MSWEKRSYYEKQPRLAGNCDSHGTQVCSIFEENPFSSLDESTRITRWFVGLFSSVTRLLLQEYVIQLTYGIGLNATPGFHFSFRVFGWGSIKMWRTKDFEIELLNDKRIKFLSLKTQKFSFLLIFKPFNPTEQREL